MKKSKKPLRQSGILKRLRPGTRQIDLLNKGALPLYCLRGKNLAHKDVPPDPITYVTSPGMMAPTGSFSE